MKSWIITLYVLWGSGNLICQSNFSELETELNIEFALIENQPADRDSLNQLIISFENHFLEVLSLDNSFEFSFDSLYFISKMEDKQSGMRIFTWQVMLDENAYRHGGIIQLERSPGQPIRLNDISEELEVSEVMELQQGNWLGCYYYNIIPFTGADATYYYLLLGFDSYDRYSNKKIVDILYFDSKNQPYFGAPVLQHGDGMRYRRVLTYDETASTIVNFDAELDKLMLSHLIPGRSIGLNSNNISEEVTVYTVNDSGDVVIKKIKPSRKIDRPDEILLRPDGSYEGYCLVNGIWEHIKKVFNQVSDTAPRPKPIFTNPDRQN